MDMPLDELAMYVLYIECGYTYCITIVSPKNVIGNYPFIYNTSQLFYEIYSYARDHENRIYNKPSKYPLYSTFSYVISSDRIRMLPHTIKTIRYIFINSEQFQIKTKCTNKTEFNIVI